MGGIAEVLANEGYQISGSDLAPNPVTQQLASLGATHASEMYARNVLNFVLLLLQDGALTLDWSDALLAGTVWPSRAASASAGD